jgi:valine--pyruvate aminotransferase
MDDMGKAAESSEPLYMLGGGNPAPIPEVNELWKKRIASLSRLEGFTHSLIQYETPQGMGFYLETLCRFFNDLYDWDLSPENIAITPGSQSAFFLLFNMFGGTTREGTKQKILFPLSPEYIGYADQSIEEGVFTGCPGIRKELDDSLFKYEIDFDNLPDLAGYGAICLSSPANPSGNIASISELERLSELADTNGIPLIIDNAYGAPFPNIVFSKIKPVWNKNTILGFSLSKLGLPSARVGILVAGKEYIQALSACNAVISLANGSIGQVLTQPLFASGEILRVCNDIIQPYYLKKRDNALNWVKEYFPPQADYRIHCCEGGFFLWIWVRNISISTLELYSRLKDKRVLIVPGEYFFFGLDKPDTHTRQCFRINFALDETAVLSGIKIIGDCLRGYLFV